MKPFLNNLWSSDLVLKTFGIDTCVYPHDNIINAYEVSQARLKIELFDKYVDEIPGASEMINVLRTDLDQIVDKLKTESGHDLGDLNSDVMEYLSATKITLQQFTEEYHSSYLCWPEKKSKNLAPCFREYPLYRFYEEHYRTIKGGVHTFIQLIPSVKEPIQRAEIREPFFWDTIDVEFLKNYNDAVTYLNDPHYVPTQVPSEITGSFLLSTGYRFLGYKDLPDWYNLFEATAKRAPAYRIFGDDSKVTVYLSPKGPIFEFEDYDTPEKTYHRVEVPKDVRGFTPRASDDEPF